MAVAFDPVTAQRLAQAAWITPGDPARDCEPSPRRGRAALDPIQNLASPDPEDIDGIAILPDGIRLDYKTGV